MMDDVKEHVRDWNDEGCVADYLTRILNKDAFDRSGLIYGLGHAVYTKTDPRCEVFRAYVNHLAAEKGREDELALYANVEKIGKQLLMERQHKSVLSTNIDFYSGFVYEMLGLPKEKIRVGNMLPAIFLPILYIPLADWLSQLAG